MLRSIRNTALFTASGLMLASAALAATPSPANSSIPACFSLVGSNGAVPDPAGAFRVIVRDNFNNPMPGATVTIDLLGCTDLKICANQLDAAATVTCNLARTSKLTDLLGQATFIVLGGSNGYNLTTLQTNATTLLGGAKILANGALLGSATASCYDLDGAGGVSVNDQSVWLTDFGSPGGPPYGRSDFDCSGSIGVNDFSLLLTELGGGNSTVSCGATCP